MFVLKTPTALWTAYSAYTFDYRVAEALVDAPQVVCVRGDIPHGSNQGLLQRVLAAARCVRQLGTRWDDIFPVLCVVLEQNDCTIAQIHINPLRRAQCDMLARAISNNTSLKGIHITAVGSRSAARVMINNLIRSPMNTGRVGEINFRF
jgi:hypothetical protein